MWLNKNTTPFSVIAKVRAITIGEVQHPLSIFSKWSEAELNAIELYTITEDEIPNDRYYTHKDELDEATVHVTRTPIDDLSGAKKKMLSSLKTHKESKQDGRPVVDTTLGFNVDGGYRDLQNLQGAKSMGLTFCIDVDGLTHTILVTDWDTIIGEVMANGLNIIQTNGVKKAEINALVTVDECILYEATPYDYTITTEDVIADDTLVEGTVVPRYTNQVTNW